MRRKTQMSPNTPIMSPAESSLISRILSNYSICSAASTSSLAKCSLVVSNCFNCWD
ncbi:MAG: hypothetical protein E6108_09580 [Clostridium perfringens]|nr:hypothetical protein [Clostridium perfringens]